MPQIVGRVDNAFTPAYLQGYFKKLGKSRTVTKGVTSIKLLFPEYDPNEAAKELKRESEEYTTRAIKCGAKSKNGTISLTTRKAISEIVSFYVDGRIAYSASSPYRFAWDSTKYTNGYHTIDMIDDDGSLVETIHVLIKNK